MKIDPELRHAIIAAARANKQRPDDSSKNLQAAVDAFLETPKGRKLKSRIMSIQADINALAKTQEDLRKKRDEIMSPLGLDMNDRRNRETGNTENYLKLGWGDDEKRAFVAAGGVLPDPERRKWSSDELLRLLAAAKDQKSFDKILSEYGINWS